MSTSQSQQIKHSFLKHPYTQSVVKTCSSQINALDAELNKYPVLRDLEAKTKIPKAHATLSLALSSVVLIFFNIFGLAQPVSNLIGWALPAFLSVRAIESPQTNDDKQWLTYWVVFGLLNLAESLCIRPILYWFPMYFVVKTVIIVYLMLPATRGAEQVYHHIVRPLVSQAKARAQSPTSNTNPFNKSEGFSMAGTTAPSSFEHDKTL